MIKELVLTSLNEVYIIGVAHSDLSEQLDDLKDMIITWHPDVVLLEGNFDKATFSIEEEAIERGKEMGYVSFLCKSRNIPLFSNDPSNEETFNFVKEEFGEIVSKGYFALRDFEFNQNKNCCDIKELKSLISDVLSEEFEENKSYEDYFNPLSDLNKFNEVTRKLNIFRDDYMLKEILVLIKSYKKLLVIKGDNHITENFEKIKKAIQNAK